jgi:hypothetical protein
LLEADEHERALVKIRSELNTLNDVSRLPIEHLVVIFQYYAKSDVASKPYEWTAIICVYRQWRNVALNTPSLWTTLMLSARNPNFVPSTIKWSVDLSLDVESYYMKSAKNLGLVEAVFRKIRRVRSLIVRTSALDLKSCIPFSVETPQLQTLLAQVWKRDEVSQG